MAKGSAIVPAAVESKILSIRGAQILLDADLAEVYAVTTKALNQAVKRNASRFPADFRFQLSGAERDEVVTNCDHLARLKYSSSLPWAFTEHGAIMAASVLDSPRAVERCIGFARESSR